MKKIYCFLNIYLFCLFYLIKEDLLKVEVLHRSKQGSDLWALDLNINPNSKNFKRSFSFKSKHSFVHTNLTILHPSHWGKYLNKIMLLI